MDGVVPGSVSMGSSAAASEGIAAAGRMSSISLESWRTGSQRGTSASGKGEEVVSAIGGRVRSGNGKSSAKSGRRGEIEVDTEGKGKAPSRGHGEGVLRSVAGLLVAPRVQDGGT